MKVSKKADLRRKDSMRILDQRLFDQVIEQARHNPRLRQNYNLHQDYADPCQRLLNALEPGTYVRPHRHSSPPKPECFLALRGRLAAVLFAENGEIERVIEFAPAGPVAGLEIPPGRWHALVALESGSLFFECKPGPYQPLTDKDWAAWAPLEGAPEAGPYLEQLLTQVRARQAQG
jgi:cupin fold WbuC family metalloprotein